MDAVQHVVVVDVAVVLAVVLAVRCVVVHQRRDAAVVQRQTMQRCDRLHPIRHLFLLLHRLKILVRSHRREHCRSRLLKRPLTRSQLPHRRLLEQHAVHLRADAVHAALRPVLRVVQVEVLPVEVQWLV